ncbi:hypothetical protein [Ramlibacter sp.]|uniref:hypothetical protein n=1 Tax=Ramlibacter sp. TaxID=1917967 RepID=UPI003D0E97DE
MPFTYSRCQGEVPRGQSVAGALFNFIGKKIMTHFASASAPMESIGPIAFLRAPSPEVLWGGALFAVAICAIAVLSSAETPPMAIRDSMPPAFAAAAAPKQAVMTVASVYAIRELASDDDTGARQFELTLRMRDGTTRVSHETGTASWRPGDEVRLIGGSASR